MTSICNFAKCFSLLVGVELEEARQLDHQSRETSWTDRMLLELKRLRDSRIVAVTSNEKTTGGDMDWWFVNRKVGANFCLTVQAKILHYSRKDPLLWLYEELAHPAHKPGKQSQTLVSHTWRMRRKGMSNYPYYIFYNPAGANSLLSSCMPSGPGVTAIDGFAVAAHIRQHVALGGFPVQQKRLSTIGPMMVGLPDLLCFQPNKIPTPEEVANRVDDIWRKGLLSGAWPAATRRRRPVVESELPQAIGRLIETREGTLDPAEGLVERDTVVFVTDE